LQRALKFSRYLRSDRPPKSGRSATLPPGRPPFVSRGRDAVGGSASSVVMSTQSAGRENSALTAKKAGRRRWQKLPTAQSQRKGLTGPQGLQEQSEPTEPIERTGQIEPIEPIERIEPTERRGTRVRRRNRRVVLGRPARSAAMPARMHQEPAEVSRRCAASPPCGSLAPAAKVAACPHTTTEF
jgi:hypothetical protein